ncbi:bifunctional adenosylcobinamide kinase/adenosylcobinamide-phosphate guanylyltransferase [Nocardioides aurantiacus]|uniref:Adenosylcobinamide kinase n=1 Tax=Nocardioides aurantiacus TaxID=86796 RepID=A0A3N2CRX7_9ACTN|nr:bifunctional adenosylcobinamide kinase/adenosylcobinamide-phosphate guanylyltransferase [Nocardioides aurantiacus]ROR90270.1 adenosylcobinamide kinase /adenosylcobinamide-phosphate guanylyltransferase [Nocardioides aurantiacus]
MKVLVTGGVRSGKSRHAEELLVGQPSVTYVAPGPTTDEDPDPDWADRVAAHRERRPASWTTRESRDLGAALAVEGAVLVDCLGTWLTAVIDEAQAWEQPSADVHALVSARLTVAVAALSAAAGPVVLVTNEVGLGVVPSHRSGRLFRDLLGTVNQTLGAACDEVHLVVAGRVLVL